MKKTKLVRLFERDINQRAKEIRKKIKIPIVSIGGINKENISEVINAGADSAVAISAIIAKNNV